MMASKCLVHHRHRTTLWSITKKQLARPQRLFTRFQIFELFKKEILERFILIGHKTYGSFAMLAV